ncbi:MAG: ArsR/SmtB family transcription factor [Candidatus Limnocylindrales bacterium]
MAAIRNPSRTSPQRPGGLVRPGISAAQLPVVELDARTAYDFLASACNECGELEDILAEDRRWLEESRASLKAEVGDDEGIAACGGFVPEIGRMLVGRPEIRSARDIVETIDALPDRELTEIMAGELLEDADLGAVTRQAVDGDVEAFKELQSRLASAKGKPVLTRPITDLAPAARQVVDFWLPRYEKVEAHVSRMLERDVAGRRNDDIAGDPMGFVERATNGVRVVPEQRIRRIVLAPTYFGRPYNSLTKVGDVQLICYPIADSSLGSADRLTPPNATVRLYRALGDESRLRILKLLSERDCYLTEIAHELDLSKPTILHHLAALRSAGLVTITDQGNMTYYSLRHDRAEEAGVELRAYLAH